MAAGTSRARRFHVATLVPETEVAMSGRHLVHAPLTRHAHEVDARTLLRQLAPYRQASTRRAVFELAVTIVPFALLWLLMLVTLQAGHLAGLLLALPAGAFLLRLFLI